MIAPPLLVVPIDGVVLSRCVVVVDVPAADVVELVLLEPNDEGDCEEEDDEVPLPEVTVDEPPQPVLVVVIRDVSIPVVPLIVVVVPAESLPGGIPGLLLLCPSGVVKTVSGLELSVEMRRGNEGEAEEEGSRG